MAHYGLKLTYPCLHINPAFYKIFEGAIGSHMINISPSNPFPNMLLHIRHFTKIVRLLWLLRAFNLHMLRLLLSKGQECKDFRKPFKTCHLGVHWIALAEYSQMSYTGARVSVILLGFLLLFVLAKLATSSTRVNWLLREQSHLYRVDNKNKKHADIKVWRGGGGGVERIND